MTDVASYLARFAAHPGPPDQALRVLQLSLLDWCAVGVAGQREPVAKILRAQALDEAGAAQAGMIGSPQKVPARMAAMVNGATSHALDYDDTHFAHIGHPSVAVIPAALAVAQLTGASGAAFQQAALIGAEASIRVGIWLGRGHYQVGFHQTATAGAFGATLAAARLLQLDQRQTKMALGLVSTRASGLKSQFGSMGKPMNAGYAAANGVETALLAQRGFISNPNAIEGVSGVSATHHGEEDTTAFDQIGQTWLFETISHKYHACCHGLHAMLEALVPVLPLDPDEIIEVEIATHPRWMSVCNIAAPTTGLEAKFSYKMLAAMRFLGHETGQPDSFTDALCQDAAIKALRDKVDVRADEHLSEMQAKLRITLQSGEVRELFHDLDMPQSLTMRQDRIMTKAIGLLGQTRADRLWQMVLTRAAPDCLMAELA
jgi:2-methylcitrate dehydratase PrpD